MRVLISSTAGHGHVFPMIPLARAFLAAGHTVLWATNGGAVDLVGAAGIDAVETGLRPQALREQQRAHRVAAEQARPQDRAALTFPSMFGAAFTPPMAAELLPLATDWRPDLMVHENAELAAPLVAAVLGLPLATHAFGGAVPEPILAAAAGRVADTWRRYGLEPAPLAGCYRSAYLDICPPSVQAVPIDHISTRLPVRPVPYAGELSASDDFPLTGDLRPLVYVTIGTVRTPAELAAAVAGVASLDVRVLATIGPNGDVDSLGPQPPNVVVKRFVPQTLVLPKASVVVSHGGSGTFLGALGHGIPQLCVPKAADQFRNAEGGVRSGAALSLTPPRRARRPWPTRCAGCSPRRASGKLRRW